MGKAILRTGILFFSWLIMMPGLVFAQPVEWKASLDSAKISVGDPLRLRLEAKVFSPGERIDWPDLRGRFQRLEILRSTLIDTLIQPEWTRFEQDIWITGFDSGLFYVPAINVQVHSEGKEPYKVISDSLAVHVTILDVDTSVAFREIKDILPSPFSWIPLAQGIGLGLLLLVLAYFLYRWWKKKPIGPVKPIAPPLPLHEQTLMLIDELESRQLWQKGEVKAYYVELSDILRTYLEKRFKMAALELTTAELLGVVVGHKELNAYRKDLGMILENADLAKFARASLHPHDHLQSMDLARQFVRSTPEIIIERPTQS